MSDGRYMGSSDYDMLTYARQEIEELRSALARREDQLIDATNACDELRAENRRLQWALSQAHAHSPCLAMPGTSPDSCWLCASIALSKYAE